MKERPKRKAQLTRREFVAVTGALTAFPIVPRHVLAAADNRPQARR
jgi:hypothetical protein